jgi:hypothetical protein
VKNNTFINRRKPARFEWALNKALIIALASFAIVLGYVGFIDLWQHLYKTASSLDIGLIVAVTTLVIAIGLIMFARYTERRLEIETQLKTQKIEIYDQFLLQLGKLFQREHGNADLIQLIVEWQSKLILWSDNETLYHLFLWHDSLLAQDANSLTKLEGFLRALREEIGHPSSDLEQGAFLHLMINHGAFLQKLSKPKNGKS